MVEINHPFPDKIPRYLFTSEGQSEDIGDLRSENSNGDTTGETDNDGIRNKLDDRSEFEYT